MITSKYYIATLVSIFLALGIGLLIGGTMGQHWSVQAEDKVVTMLMDKYKEEAEQNVLNKRLIRAFTEMHQRQYPALKGKEVVWIGNGKEVETLPFMLEAAGASWRKAPSALPLSYEEMCSESQCPDFIIVADDKIWDQLAVSANRWSKASSGLRVIHIDDHVHAFDQPPSIQAFMHFINQLSEEHAHEAIRFYHYSGVE